MSIEQRLTELHIQLPEITPLGNYVPAVQTGRLVFVSGQLPKQDGRIAYKGRVGKDLDLHAAKLAARVCVANLLAALKEGIGSLDKVKKIVRLTGYINTYPGFTDHTKVMDAASELLVEIFGNNGKHSRVVIGCVELPFGAALEMDLIAEV